MAHTETQNLGVEQKKQQNNMKHMEKEHLVVKHTETQNLGVEHMESTQGRCSLKEGVNICRWMELPHESSRIVSVLPGCVTHDPIVRVCTGD